MSMGSLGIVFGAEGRLREAIKAKVRQAHAEALARVTNPRQKEAIKERIRREIREEIRRVSSPYSLWSS